MGGLGQIYHHAVVRIVDVAGSRQNGISASKKICRRPPNVILNSQGVLESVFTKTGTHNEVVFHRNKGALIKRFCLFHMVFNLQLVNYLR